MEESCCKRCRRYGKRKPYSNIQNFIQYPNLWLQNPIWFYKFAKKSCCNCCRCYGQMKPIFKYPELFLIPEVSTLILILLLKNSYKKWKKDAVNATDAMGKGNPTMISCLNFIQYPRLWHENPIWFCKFAKKSCCNCCRRYGQMKLIFKYPELFSILEASTLMLILL